MKEIRNKEKRDVHKANGWHINHLKIQYIRRALAMAIKTVQLLFEGMKERVHKSFR